MLVALQACRAMRERAAARGVKLLLPQDVVVAQSLDDDHGCCTVPLTVSCCTPDAPCVPVGGYLWIDTSIYVTHVCQIVERYGSCQQRMKHTEHTQHHQAGHVACCVSPYLLLHSSACNSW